MMEKSIGFIPAGSAKTGFVSEASGDLASKGLPRK